MSRAGQALATLRDYIERSTHWQEGGATRHDALKVALPAMEDIMLGAALELTASLLYVDSIRDSKHTSISYETMQRSGFKRKNWQRPYTLADARSEAKTAAMRLRTAWELLDPASSASQAQARRTTLGNCQEQLQIAIGHLQTVLNKCRTADEQLAADAAARDWLISIGSEPE